MLSLYESCRENVGLAHRGIVSSRLSVIPCCSNPAAAMKRKQDVITRTRTRSTSSIRLTGLHATSAPAWAPIHIGPLTLDISPTKHVVMLLIAASLCLITLLIAARAHKRQHAESGKPKGFANGIEALVLYIRQEVIIPNVGHHGDRYVPILLTMFFFILFANLLGLIPYGSTAPQHWRTPGSRS